MTIKIDRNAYRQAKQTDLAYFTENVLSSLKSTADFAFLTDEIAALDVALKNFTASLAASLNRGRKEIAMKKQAQRELVEALDRLVVRFEQDPLISDVKIISAGLKLRVTPGMLRAMPVPEVVKINSTGKKGELRVQLATPVHLRLMHASEYSLDGGNSWHNSQYYYRRKFVLTGLPSSLHLLVRFRTLGANGMTGESTEPLEVAVL